MQNPRANSLSSSVVVVDRVVVLSLSSSSSLSSAEVVVVEGRGRTVASSRLLFVESSSPAAQVVEDLVTVNVCVAGAEVIVVSSRAPQCWGDLLQQHGMA